MSDTDNDRGPKYYLSKTGMQAIEIIESFELDFHRGNAIKYILRAGRKTEDVREDIGKAIWYLNRFLTQNERCADVVNLEDKQC